MKPLRAARRALVRVVSLVAKCRALSSLILRATSFVARRLPDGNGKAHLSAFLLAIPWPALRFDALPLIVGGETLQLVPHLGEFDWAALIFRELPYEAAMYNAIAKFDAGYDVVLDIGSNVGLFSLFAASRFPQASVYSFEPEPDALKRLLENLEHNSKLASRISVLGVAVADRGGVAAFHAPRGHLTNGSLVREFAENFDACAIVRRIGAVAAAEVASLLKAPGKNLIKIDAEGAEPQILRAMQGIAEKFDVEFLIEVLPAYDREIESIEWITRLGFNRYVMDGSWRRAETLVADTRHRDWLLSRRSLGEARS